MQTYKVKSIHHWFADEDFLLSLITQENGEKIIRFQNEAGESKDTNNRLFDPTNASDIRKLFMFTGTMPHDLYKSEDKDEIMRINDKLSKRWTELMKWAQTGDDLRAAQKEYIKERDALFAKNLDFAKTVRKWIYSFPLNPPIRIIFKSTCCCNMGHCGAPLDLEIGRPIYRTLGELFAEFSGNNIPCTANVSICESNQGVDGECTCGKPSNTENPFYEHPDSVILHLETCDKNHIYSVHEEQNCYNKNMKEIKLDLGSSEEPFTLMSWSYGR